MFNYEITVQLVSTIGGDVWVMNWLPNKLQQYAEKHNSDPTVLYIRNCRKHANKNAHKNAHKNAYQKRSWQPRIRSSRSSDQVHHYHSDAQHQRDVQLSKDGWRPMFSHPVTPPQQQQQQQQQMNYNVAKSGVASLNNAKEDENDFASYDYGSSEDDASVVVRPYEVPSQVCMICNIRARNIFGKTYKVVPKFVKMCNKKLLCQ